MIPRSHHIDQGDLEPKSADPPVVIAILDTGVDPNAQGLQVTSTNLPKIIDLIDCSGAGDIAMVQRPIDLQSRTVVGKTGRILHIPDDWITMITTAQINDNRVRVGVVEAYSLFPRPLVKRHRHKRNEPFTDRNRTVELNLHGDLSDCQKRGDDEAAADIELRLKELKSLSEKYDVLDIGPVFDAIMFMDSDGLWRIAIDTACDGRLEHAKLIKEYRFDKQFSTFGSELLSYSFNVYESGGVLSVVTVAGSHGTHVAGIAAAHFPGQPHLDGVNPSAQIISMKIGDTRLGSMETCTAMIRALTACINSNVDIVNMSYGEPTSVPNHGRVCHLLNQLVHKHNIVFVGSAGNAGPALSTVGAPAGTTDGAISVGAFVTSEMAQQLYSVRCDVPPQQTTWSSRGPCIDGGRGVTISAPGAAIAPVPTWTLNNKQLMNGTSMSSPNAAGSISNLIGFCRGQGISISPARIRRAIENTAVPVDGVGPLTIGHGLLSTRQAAAYLSLHKDDIRQDIRFEVVVGGSNRGILIRESRQVKSPSIHSVKVIPHIPDDTDNVSKSLLELHMALKCDSQWVSCPIALVVCNEGRSFSVEVNPSSLQPNTVYFTEIVATIDDALSNGPIIMFRVPITVIIPLIVDGITTTEFPSLQFKPGTIVRNFVQVPNGAGAALITVVSHGNEDGRQFVLHTLYNEKYRSHRDTSHHKYITVHGTRRHQISIPVKERTTLEVTLAQFWSTLGSTVASLSIEWCGISSSPSALSFSGVDRVSRIDVTSLLKTESVEPSANITDWITPLIPISPGVISGLSVRDTLPNQRHTYALILTYKFAQITKCSIIMEYPLLNNLLYESDFGSQMCHIHNSSKQLVHVSDAFPKSISLEKGDYTVRIEIRHEEYSVLESMKLMPANLVRKLPKPIEVDIYRKFSDAVLQKKPPKSEVEVLHQYEPITYFVSIPSGLTTPKGFTPSSSLRGALSIMKSGDPVGKAMQVPITYYACQDHGAKSDSAIKKDTGVDGDVTPESALRDCIIAWIGKNSQSFANKYCRKGLDLVLSEFPRHQPALVLKLKEIISDLESEKDGEKRRALNDQMLSLCSIIIDDINMVNLASDCGVRPPKGAKTAPFTKSIQDKKKTLSFALLARATGQTRLSDDDHEGLDQTMTVLQRWVDLNDPDTNLDYLAITAEYYVRHGQYGHAIHLLNGQDAIVTKDPRLHKLRQDVLGHLQWDHWIAIQDNRHLQATPDDWALF